MRIAVAAEGSEDTAEVNGQAARAPYFLICDGPDEVVELLENPFGQHQRAMGLRIADFLATKGVELFLARHFGEQFEQSLTQKGIQCRTTSGTVRDAVAAAYGAHGGPGT